MRSVWSTLVAVTLVVAGVRVTAASTGRAGHSELHAAKCLQVAPTVRRAHGSSRALAAVITVARVELAPVSRHALPMERAASVSQPVDLHLLVRTARGPPRA